MSRVRVFVADDHPMYREGLVRAIKERPDLELVGESSDGRTALPEIRRLTPDVAVLDVRMPGLTGTEVLNAIARERIATRVVFLSAHVDSDLVYRAVAMGAAAYLSKEADRATIFDAVAAVARGETVLSPEVQSGLAAQIQLRETESRPVLSPREQEVLRLIAEGRSAPAIARHLHLSPSTVKTHLQSLYEKLGVSDRAAAVAVAMRSGLLE
ncbi:MAG TPA: response regulator transcription factor [Baekduia sp.]|uniref:response regulator transcription factor n=1 Tax=Baekduia sp. TaxID=2600305 RepID=UPI002CBBDBE0|nr:response regulator transcription factor [Baekduia sp.]HMJ36834.1 response regulator transcription factor [Baekduia sp.]